MITKIECHLRALTELVELMSIGGWLAILADIIWVFSDLYLAPTRIELYFIALFLSFAFIISTLGLLKYHFKCVHKLFITNGKCEL